MDLVITFPPLPRADLPSSLLARTFKGLAKTEQTGASKVVEVPSRGNVSGRSRDTSELALRFESERKGQIPRSNYADLFAEVSCFIFPLRKKERALHRSFRMIGKTSGSHARTLVIDRDRES